MSVAVHTPAGGELLDGMEAAAVQLVVLGLVQARDRWAALVEDGEDHQVVAGVDGDAEGAACCAAAGVATWGLSWLGQRLTS
ncbi:hypothetical protein [Nonomuraea sp. C10]|uniref:hypothetical protein n=1 Tax=Nonomuraea sp. C10 TaxID=2600577 RepID=UPI001C9D6474|nr:hypothetical protein [Nonomuraea sp. C10]